MVVKRLVWLGLAMAVAAQAAVAGGPPGRRGRGGYFPGRPRGNAFDAVRRYFDLTPEQQAALGKLDGQRAADEREAMVKLARELDKKYAALILEILPDDQKATYEKVLAALAERDEAREAAEKAYREVVNKVREAQGVGGPLPGHFLPRRKADVIRTCIKLTEEQRAAIDGVQRDAWAGMREKFRAVPRPKDWRDAEARRKYAEAMRKLREDIETQAAEAMAMLLDEEQKKAYGMVAAALDAYQKALAEADETCEKKLAELVGPERAKAFRGDWWRVPPMVHRPGGPPPKGGEAKPPKKAAEF